MAFVGNCYGVCTEKEQKEHANVLLDCAESKSIFGVAFGGAKIKNRIGRILTYRKLSVCATVFFGVFAVFVGYAFLTNAK